MMTKRMPARSVVLMECILRFRRPSTLALLLISCVAAFLLMPETSSGGVMFLIGAQRTLLNSAVTALTSAVMGGLIFSLMGFYLISNSVTRDRQSGVGQLIAATPLSSLRYLAGKLFGNIAYVAAMVSVFMIACMGMHVIRGEMPLEPMVFINTFAIMFVPSIPCIAAIALLFECVPFLSGRGGEVFFFFFWVLTLSVPVVAASAPNGNPWIFAMDLTGMGFFIKEIILVTGTHSFTIGYAPFNAALPPRLFSGLLWEPALIVPRLASVLVTIPFFAIAWASFQRFDPARRSSREQSRPGKLSRLGQTFATAWLRLVVPRGGWLVGSPSFVKAILLDVRLTLALSPLFFIVIVCSSISGLLVPVEGLRTSILPVIFFILVPFLAAISTRDRQRNTAQLIFSAPHVKSQFALLKFFSALTSAVLLAFIPLIRLSFDDPFAAASTLNAVVFLVSAATGLGLLTRTPKTFVVLFLLFLYLAISSKTVAAFDVAGLHGIVTPPIILSYTAASILMMAIAVGVERWRMMRDE
jgi:hypothetical protein